MKPEVYECVKCGQSMACRSGWRSYPKHPRWKKRLRRCAGCGHEETYLDAPLGEIAGYIRATTAMREARNLMAEAKGALSSAQELARAVNQLRG